MYVILRVDYAIPNPFNPYFQTTNTNVAKLTLAQGYYYFEVVARDIAGGNYYYFSMSVPPSSLGSNIANPTYQVDNVFIAPKNIQPEIITITVDSTVVNKTYQLYYYSGSGSSLTKVISSSISVGASVQQFSSSISNLGDFTNYNPNIALSMYDSSNNLTSNISLARYYVYTLTFIRLRPSTAPKTPYCTTSLIKIGTTQNHSSGLGGTYSISINGALLNVYDSQTNTYSTSIQPYNNVGNIQNALKAFYNLPSLSELVV